MNTRQAHLYRLFQQTFQLLWLPLALIGGASVLFLIALYHRPFTLHQDIGAQPVAITGLYAPERSSQLTYAYSDGTAAVRLPQAGIGRYLVQLRMAGPGGTQPVPARLSVARQQADLGQLEQMRVYRLLLPSNEQGDLAFQIHSGTASPPGDERQLGALLDWLAVRSAAPGRPPPLLLLGAPLLLVLLAGAVTQLATRIRWKLVLCLITGAALGSGYALSRGRLALPGGWIVLGTWAAVALIVVLSRYEGQGFATPWVGIAALFVAWRAALWLIGGLAIWYSESLYRLGELLSVGGGVQERQRDLHTLLIARWLQWDSEHYVTIAQQGYNFFGEQWPNIAFFPLYPLLIRLVLPLTSGDVAIAALLIAHLAYLAALLLLYDLLAHDFSQAIAYRTVILLLIFPVSLFFVAGYSEALALALTVVAVWAMRRQRWWLAGLAGALLALTRLPGVLLAPVLALVYLQQHRWRWRALGPAGLAALLPPAGLTIFMLFQWWRFGTPTAFLQAQRSWDNGLSMPWTMPYAMFEELTTTPDWPVLLPHMVAWLGFIALALLGVRRLPLAYSLTMLLLLLPPYLSSYPRSMARYVMIAFPAFVALALWAEPQWRRRLLIALMLPLLVIAVMLFVNGFWVA